MISIRVLGRTLTLGFRNGCGFDLEFPSSKATWVTLDSSDEVHAAAFKGVLILLPFTFLSYGNCYVEYEWD